MSKKLMCIDVTGKSGNRYGFMFYGDKKYLEEWKEEGFEVIVIDNLVPSIVHELGLTIPFCFLQDLFNFKNPFKDYGNDKVIEIKQDE